MARITLDHMMYRLLLAEKTQTDTLRLKYIKQDP